MKRKRCSSSFSLSELLARDSMMGQSHKRLHFRSDRAHVHFRDDREPICRRVTSSIYGEKKRRSIEGLDLSISSPSSINSKLPRPSRHSLNRGLYH